MLGLDGEHVVVPARTVALVPPLVVHGFRNASDADARYLNFHAPGRRFADYMRGLRDGRPFTYDQEPPPARTAGADRVSGCWAGSHSVDVEEDPSSASCRPPLGTGTATCSRR